MNPPIDPRRVAALAGIAEERVLVWLKAGLFERVPPRTEDWVARCQLLAQLERAGVPADVIVAAEQADVLERAYVFEYLRQQRPGEAARSEVLRASGLTEELLQRLCYALGFDDTERFSLDEQAVFVAMAEALREGVPEATLLETCELWGSQMRFTSSAEVVSFDANLARRVMAAAESAVEGVARLAPLTLALLRTAEMMLLPLHRRHLLQAINLQAEPSEAGEGARAPGAVEVAIGFVDLSGYTALTEKEGDVQALTYARRLERIVLRVGRGGGPRIVKRLGDGLMLASPTAARMLGGILQIVEVTRERENMPAARAAVAFGPAQSRAGDYFGHTVNLAARILTLAQAGEVLVSDRVVDESAGGPFAFREPRDVSLRGLREPLRVWRAEAVSAVAKESTPANASPSARP